MRLNNLTNYNMKIQLVSYKYNISGKKRIDLTASIFNDSKADVIMFSGKTIFNSNELSLLQSMINNKKTFGIFEVQKCYVSYLLRINHALFIIKNGKIENLYSNQLFATSKDINNNIDLAKRLILELETRRKLVVDGIHFTILQCGENNILANKTTHDADRNYVYFRFKENKELDDRFTKILETTDVFLNPIHTPMGNLGKMYVRKEFFSYNSRYYFSANNSGDPKNNRFTKLESSNMIYGYFNGKRMQPEYTKYDHFSDYRIDIFEIDATSL